VAATLAGVVTLTAWPHLRTYVGASPPAQVDHSGPLDPALTQRYQQVLGIAHNAGNHADTAKAALGAGADVIEIDVVEARGILVAGRNQPLPRVAGQLFRGLSLEQAWSIASSADTIKLDLKRDDPAFLDKLVDFLRSRVGAEPTMISSRDARSLRLLHVRLPSVTLLLSAGHPEDIQRLRNDASLQRVVDGVSLYQGQVEPGLVSWLHQRGLLVIAWTVNDTARVTELVRIGVDGVTTANLAILRALS
jgi:hypothetical protein